MLSITPTIQRQFILGQQGLFPGRRWEGKAGVIEALWSGSVVQVDPLNVLARSHDIALYGRVIGYQPELLDTVLHTDRAAFDWGGTVTIFPMHELPYLRVIMQRKREEQRWAAFAAEHEPTIAAVRALIREQGPVTSREISSKPSSKGTFRSGKISGLALYYLWLSGELMTHSRRGFERRYDLMENIAPPEFQHHVSVKEADDYFARRIFDYRGMASEKSWRASFAGTVERRVSPEEASERLNALAAEGFITPVTIQPNSNQGSKAIYYVKTEHLPWIETLVEGKVPGEWQPREISSAQEMTFLAPLEIVSARGRARELFDFDYVWEVYKPVETRRWGYYTLPILYGDRLVARFDSRMDRETRTFILKNFWLEPWAQHDDIFNDALKAAFRRFVRFVGAEKAAVEPGVPEPVADLLNE